ncbi:unnamed protein product, partial [Closterium sp. NIES-53]
AVEDLSRSLEIEPDNQDALQHRGIIAFHIHLYSMAIADLSRALDMRPMDAYLIRAKTWVGAGHRRNASAMFSGEAPCLTLQSTLPFLPPPSSPPPFPTPFPPSSPRSSSPQGIALAGAGHCRNASSVFSEAVRHHSWPGLTVKAPFPPPHPPLHPHPYPPPHHRA